MKLTISVKELRAALTKAARAIEVRNAIPILGTFHLLAADGGLTVTGTNLDLEIEASAPAVVSEPGAICIGRAFLRLIRSLPNWDAISLVKIGDRLVVDMPDGRASFIGVPAEEYPFMDREGEKRRWITPAQPIFDGFARVTPFMSNEETRYYLNGVCLESGSGKLSFVATDGHRLGKMTIDAAGWSDFRIIYPSVAVAKFFKTFGKGDLGVEYFPNKHLRFSQDGIRFTSKFIDGKFPDYNRIIPASDKAQATVEFSPSAWADKLPRLLSISDRRFGGSLIKISAKRVTISAHNVDMGEIVVALAGKVECKQPNEFGANLAFLQSCLRAHWANSVKVYVIDTGSPIKFESEGMMTILMPLRNAISKIELPEGCEA